MRKDVQSFEILYSRFYFVTKLSDYELGARRLAYHGTGHFSNLQNLTFGCRS